MPASYVESTTTNQHRNWAVGQHLVGLLSLADMTFLGFIASLVMWRVKADDSAWLDDHGREAVNFQLSLLLYAIVGSIVVALLSLIIFAMVTVPVWLLGLTVLRIYGCVKAAIAANRGEYYRYPMCIRFMSPKNAA